MTGFASNTLNPLVLPPDDLWDVSFKVQDEINASPWLQLPNNPDKIIGLIIQFCYYPILRVTTIVMEDYLLLILSIPLIEKSLRMKLYKVHNLPVLKLQLSLQYKYVIEGEYLAVSDGGMYASLSKDHDVHICEMTQGYLCMLEKAL